MLSRMKMKIKLIVSKIMATQSPIGINNYD